MNSKTEPATGARSTVAALLTVLSAVALLLIAAPEVSAMDTRTPGLNGPIDLMDLYSGAVTLDMSKCCDCHSVECE